MRSWSCARKRGSTAPRRSNCGGNFSRHGVRVRRQKPTAGRAAGRRLLIPTGTPAQDRVEDRVAALEESSQLLNSKINDQYQTKIEAASKYRIRLSGIVLLNVFGNHGSVDNQDFPTWAIPASANLPGTVFWAPACDSRRLGSRYLVPDWREQRRPGNLQVDFSGGFTNASDGVNLGLVRLRVASLRMDWKNTSIVAGTGRCLYVSALADLVRLVGGAGFRLCRKSLGMDPAGASGTPIRFLGRTEHYASGRHDGQCHRGAALRDLRAPGASRREFGPARLRSCGVSWTRSVFGMPLTLGAAGYYSRQNWVSNNHVDGWAGMTDWSVPLTKRVSLTGEFYRGALSAGWVAE